MKYEQLPLGASFDEGLEQRHQALYAYLSRPFVDTLIDLFAGKRVVEAYAGRGVLASILQAKGVDIHPTSLRRAHDGTEILGFATEVEDCSVLDAVVRYGEEMDYLLVCWPVADDSLWRVLGYLPPNLRIVFIGEVTDYTCTPRFLGGCATDRFFDSVIECEELTARITYPTPRLDTVKVYRPNFEILE